MAELHVLRVFTAASGEHGNPLGVFLDSGQVPPEDRQRVAAELGFSETVFVDDPARGEIRIFTPARELGFAGHPTVGTAWLLAESGIAIDALRPPAGEVAVRREGDLTFVAARPEWSPPFELTKLSSRSEIEALDAGSSASPMAYCWAWSDEAAGEVRARSFPGEAAGISEDEATGSAAIMLCAALGRPITIRQGRGSILVVAPLDDGRAEVGGRCVLDEVREHSM